MLFNVRAHQEDPCRIDYLIQYTPQEKEIIRRDGLQGRMVYDLTPKGDPDKVRQELEEHKDNLEYYKDRLAKCEADTDNYYVWRHAVIPGYKARIEEHAAAIPTLEEELWRLTRADNFITLGQFLDDHSYHVKCRTVKEARYFETELEKALIRTKKYIEALVPPPPEPAPEPEKPHYELNFSHFALPEHKWFESIWLIAPPGSGKTNALHYLVNSRVLAAFERKATIIIMDGQGQEQSLGRPWYLIAQDQTTYINPRRPIPINPFLKEAGDPRIAFNAAREMLLYFMSGIVDQPLTSNHETVLENALELIFETPDATLYTLMDILDPQRKNLDDYEIPLSKIDPFTAKFLKHDLFQNRMFSSRREELTGRLYAMLRDRTFRAMLSDPKATFNFTEAMNQGNLIVIDCDKNYLRDRAEIFGRFFIALIHRAAVARSDYPPGKPKLPVYFFIDECHDFIARDERIYQILEQARKQKISVIMANQFTTQIDNQRVRDSLFSATGTKLVARTSTETLTLSNILHCSREAISHAPKFNFVFHHSEMDAPIYTAFSKMTFPDPLPEDRIVLAEVKHKQFYAELTQQFHEALDAKNWEVARELAAKHFPSLLEELEAIIPKRDPRWDHYLAALERRIQNPAEGDDTTPLYTCIQHFKSCSNLILRCQ